MARKAQTLNSTPWSFTPTDATFDPTGIDLKRQARDAYAANRDAMRAADYGEGGNTIDQAVHMTGPLPDPQWQAFFQALTNQHVSDVSGGPSAPGSKQLRGTTAQPDYLSGGDTYFNVLTPTGALKRRALLKSLADEQDQFTTNLYATRGEPGTDVTPTPTRRPPTVMAPPPPLALVADRARTPQTPTDDQGAALAWLRSRARFGG